MASPSPDGLAAASAGVDDICVVCNSGVAGRVYQLGGRVYCARHYAQAAQSAGTWPSVWILTLALVGLGALTQILGAALTPMLSRDSIIVTGLVLSLLPALIWLAVFRRLDRLEPEPHSSLIEVMILAALLSAAVAEPLRRGLFGLPFWSEDRWYWAIPISTLTQGVLLALTIYLTVRFSAFLLAEFDERTDGIIYGTAAGLGVGVSYNIRYLLDAGGVRLDVGAARMFIAALVIASIGGLIGYGLGQVRFEPHSEWYLPGILLLAALLTGVFEWLNGEALSRSLHFTVWAPVLVAALFGFLLFGAINLLVRNTIRETLAIGARPGSGLEGTASR
jgi:RsiW-degrading membrane proteinase PrsW (M82 family)